MAPADYIARANRLSSVKKNIWLEGPGIYIIIHVNSGGRNSPELVSFIWECWETGRIVIERTMQL